MTYLELIARVGTSPMDVVKMYLKDDYRKGVKQRDRTKQGRDRGGI